VWVEGLLFLSSVCSGVLGYRAARSRNRSAIFWALLSACLLFPLALLWQLPPPDAANRDRYPPRIALAVGWFFLLTAASHSIFPRIIPFPPLAHLETALATWVASGEPFPTQYLQGDLSSAFLLAAVGLSLSLFCVNRPLVVALFLTTIGFALGIGVGLFDRMLQVARFEGGSIPELPRGPFAVACILLLTATIFGGWASRWRPAV
jgi:hypothetical protein